MDSSAQLSSSVAFVTGDRASPRSVGNLKGTWVRGGLLTAAWRSPGKLSCGGWLWRVEGGWVCETLRFRGRGGLQGLRGLTDPELLSFQDARLWETCAAVAGLLLACLLVVCCKLLPAFSQRPGDPR